ncbi:MAG: 50S ribosomal protein L18 [Planctomycetota bacterium]|nr:50S ribosomal protein L18 [Planctomycetota bacterium]
MSNVSTHEQRRKRHRRVRKKIAGSQARPRLNVFRSSKHMHAQLIDDAAGATIVAASSLSKELRERFKTGANVEAAKEVGKLVARLAREKGIEKVVFDRGGYMYHGRVKALADGAREGGLRF